MVFVYCTFSQSPLSLYEVSTNPLDSFGDARTRKFNKGNNSKSKQGRVMVLVLLYSALPLNVLNYYNDIRFVLELCPD